MTDDTRARVKEPCEVCAHVKGTQMTGPKTPSQIRYERELHEQAEEITRLQARLASFADIEARERKLMESVVLRDEEIARLRECVAGAHALRCICGDVVNAVADIRDPRCRETQAMALRPGGAPREGAGL